MGVLFETYQSTKNKKRCTVCGCIMDANHESNICENCFDDISEGYDLEDQLSILLGDKEV